MFTVTATSELSIAHVHAHCRAQTLARLRAEGFAAERYNQATGREYSYVFTQKSGKPALVVRISPDTGVLLQAFTTGDLLGFNDNFDCVPGRTVPVENCTFGAAKLLMEAHELWQRPDALPVAERAKRMGEVDRAVAKLAAKKGYGLEDPVVAACAARTIVENENENENEATAGDVEKYIELRFALLPHLPHTNPRIAKLAVGRAAYFPLMAQWGAGIDEWSVFFARRYFMARHLDLAYPFCLLHLHGAACEVSEDDDLWACKLPSTASADPLLEALDAVSEAAATRKLGRVNRCAALALVGLFDVAAAAGEGPKKSMMGTLPYAQAAAYLVACGWTRWFNTYVAAPGDDVLAPPALPSELVDALLASTMEDVEALLTGALRTPPAMANHATYSR